jgi:hypothetical protein
MGKVAGALPPCHHPHALHKCVENWCRKSIVSNNRTGGIDQTQEREIKIDADKSSNTIAATFTFDTYRNKKRTKMGSAPC